MEIKVLDIKKNSVYAINPMESEKYCAGLDFFSAYEYKIKPNGKKIIDTEIEIQIPEDMGGTLEGNKNFSYENHCTLIGETVDDRNVDDPEPDDDADIEGCCNELSNKFEKIEIDVNKKNTRRKLIF